ncbi:MAG: hypothetical protein PUD72_05735 [Oscillospiraceae bacterium]|nr:hypothetical protein [Oscillospiraceae bacterium]
MLNIDYTGMFHDDKIKEYIETFEYKKNIELYNKLYDYYSEYHLTEFKTEEIIDLKILIIISHKYNYEYKKTKKLIYRLTTELIQARFHLGILYVIFLKTQEEKEFYIDECIDYYITENTELSLRSLSNFLEDIIDLKNINKKKYIEQYADACMIQAKNYTGIRANHWINLALPKYKELGLREKYEDTLKIYNKNMEEVNNEMGVHGFEIGKDEMKKELYKHEQTLYCFFKEENKPFEDKLKLLCSIILFIGFGEHNYSYSPFYTEEKIQKKSPSLIDHCSVVTFSGNKTIKTESWEQKFNTIGRSLHRKMTIEPAINGVLDSNIKKETLKSQILNSSLIFEDDKIHIEKALNFFFEKEYDIFIYTIIPNFEKLLRNVLTINGIPEYTNKNSDPKYQITLNLTETITKIKEKQLIGINLLNKCSQLLNEEEFENYRNRLSHREDNELFSKDTAYDLFLLLIQLTLTFSDENIDLITIKTDINS